MAEAWRGVFPALTVAVAYYLGARVGFAFRAPEVPQSVLWLPNAILLATLLMTAAGRWPILLAAAFPAHLLVGQQSGAPLLPMSLLFLTNCCDALLGATAIRLATRGRWRLDGLRNFIIFLALGAVLAPAAVSFLDAAITVLTGWGSSFWSAYGTRIRANTLTNVILVPAIVGLFGRRAFEWRQQRARVAEALGLVAALAAVLYVASSVLVAPMPMLFYSALPFLILAAVRFGPGATGLALFVVAFALSWDAVHASGAFAGTPPEQNIAVLQFVLLCMSVPLLGLAAVVREREVAASDLAKSRNAFRQSVETVKNLAGRLIAGQEDERAHVARELHDGVGQYVATMAITMSAMRRNPAVRAVGLDAEFQRLYDQTSRLFESVRTLSHQLHPSTLRHEGLVPAMRALCTGFTRQYGIEAEFRSEGIGGGGAVPDGVALSVYRVTQEALANVAAHAHACRVDVSLARGAHELTLSISDNGRGFDPRAALNRGGLGLVSMEERMRLVHGRLSIDSSPAGTRISVSIPVEPLS